MKSFFGRFQLVGRKERRVLELVSDHFHLVVRTVEQLGPLLESARNGDRDAVEHMTNKVSELDVG